MNGTLVVSAQTAVARSREPGSTQRCVEVIPWRTQPGDPRLAEPSIRGAARAWVLGDFAGVETPRSGHLPLPNAARVRALARSWRSDDGDEILLFTRSETELSSAARAWFTLSWAGVARVAILAGGLPAWVRAGGETAVPCSSADGCLAVDAEAGEPDPSAYPVRLLTAAGAAAISDGGTLLDARPAEQYAGTRTDPCSGHIPGAIHAPATRFAEVIQGARSPVSLRRLLLEHRAIGAHRVGAYCHGGVASSVLVLAGALVGQPIDLYADSWSGWAKDPLRPTERGAHPLPHPRPDLDCL